MQIISDQIYYKDLALDIYIPDNKPFKTIVYFHGGGIVEGSKDNDKTKDLMEHLCKLGYGVVANNYSLYPNTKFPEYIFECANAIRYTFDNIAKYGGDNKEIYVSGQSAGSYMMMMINLDNEFLDSVKLKSSDIKGWISDAGQMNDHFNVIKHELGCNPFLQRISKYGPLYYVNENVKSNPILLMVYENDMFLREEQNLMLMKSLKLFNNDIDVTMIKLPGGHVHGSSEKDSDGEYRYNKEVIKWMKNH